MKKISVIFGTRPEAIKLAPVILALKQESLLFDCKVCVTAQHRQMLDQVLQVFDIIPDTDLNLMVQKQSLAEFSAKAIIALDAYLSDEKPDLVIVQGDTSTVFCAALSAFYNKIPVAHVEAGLRTHNIYSPWPEEINRSVTSRLTSLHFAPTELSKCNLLNEGIPESSIFVTGNTIIDALYYSLNKIESDPPELPSLIQEIVTRNDKIVLITGHRRENFGQGFENICMAIADLAIKFPEVKFIYPVHLNPNVREPVYRILSNCANHNIHLIEPLNYLEFIFLMSHATLIITDSGGIQEEAPGLGIPVLVLREETERPEGLTSGNIVLVGTEYTEIVKKTEEFLRDENHTDSSTNSNPFGNGNSAEIIVDIIKSVLTPGRALDPGSAPEGGGFTGSD